MNDDLRDLILGTFEASLEAQLRAVRRLRQGQLATAKPHPRKGRHNWICMCTVPMARRFCRETYNEPLALYQTLKQRSMDLVTVTDHDSIDAVEAFAAIPIFF